MRRLFILFALFILLIVVRVTSPVDLFEGDQQKQVGYVMDILHGGSWIAQYEVTGKIATKPPLYNWCAALAAMLFHSTRPWVMKLPSLLAGAGLLVLIYLLARRLFNESTAFWATLACMASHHFVKLVWFARTDMLMVFGLYLAIYLFFVLNSPWWKSAVMGLLMGANYLIKGPAGPSFFGVWLLVWAFEGGYLFKPARWTYLVPGFLIFTAIAGWWLASVWNMPQFRNVVLIEELGSRVPGLGSEVDAFYYYVPLLFARIAPWSLVAMITLLAAQKRLEWQHARFVALWALGMFVFLSFIPVKRHDLLLPVYPPVFILAGLGLHYFTESQAVKTFKWLVWALAVPLIVLPGVFPLLMKPHVTPLLWVMAFAVCGCGAAAALCARKPSSAAIVWLCAGAIIIHGLYHHGLGNSHPVDLYARLEKFTAPVKEDATHGKVVVWGTHPLVSYELSLHQRIGNAGDLKKYKPEWLITEASRADEVRKDTGWSLTEKEAFVSRAKFAKIDARLYHVDGQS